MSDLFNILPEAILYLTCGFSFIFGFYLLIDRRFDFFSEIGFTIMLVIGFLNVNIIGALPFPYVLKSPSLRNVLLVIVAFVSGVIIAVIRNCIGENISNFIIKYGRRKTSSGLFWYDILDKKDKPIWIRCVNIEKDYILQGVLLSLDEKNRNPYLLLGYCSKYDTSGNLIDAQYQNDDRIQFIVNPDDFNEIILIYDENSTKKIHLNIQSR